MQAFFAACGRFFARDPFGRAATAAFYFLIALFPLMLTAGRLLSSMNVRMTEVFHGFIPSELLDLFEQARMDNTLNPQNIGTLLPALITLWGASNAFAALMKQLAPAPAADPRPWVGMWNWFKGRFTALLFTLGFFAVLCLTLFLLALGKWAQLAMIAGALFFLLLLLYLYTPNRKHPKRLTLRTALAAFAATVGWFGISRLFEIYMRLFADWNALYGSLGIFFGLAIWVYLICLVVVVCGELRKTVDS